MIDPRPLASHRLRKVWQRRQCSVKGGILTISHATVSTHTHTNTGTAAHMNPVTLSTDCADQKENIMWGGCFFFFSLSLVPIWRLAQWNWHKWVVMATLPHPLTPPCCLLRLGDSSQSECERTATAAALVQQARFSVMFSFPLRTSGI